MPGYEISRPSSTIEGNFTSEAGIKGTGNPLAFLSTYKVNIPGQENIMATGIVVAVLLGVMYLLGRK